MKTQRHKDTGAQRRAKKPWRGAFVSLCLYVRKNSDVQQVWV
jgi:hypothetical protein